MARKTAKDLRPQSKLRNDHVARKSWATIGIDTSLSSVAMVGVGYDAKLDKKVGPEHRTLRWDVEVEYLDRLHGAVRVHEMVQSILAVLWVIEPDRVWIAQEEPFPFGMASRGKFKSEWIKQQCEVSGAVLGSLMRAGYVNIHQINNAQWKKVVRQDGFTIRAMNDGGKWDVKEWAVKAYGLPDLPDLVIGPGNVKIPRPASGKGANAKAVQPEDIYDAAACCAWMDDWVEQYVLSVE